MKNKFFCIVLMMIFSTAVYAKNPQNQALTEKLLGKHLFSLQWISWEKFGTAHISQNNQQLEIHAKQELNGNYATMDGMIIPLDERTFLFRGEIITRVDHIANGIECKRSGDYLFEATENRKYWRMLAHHNPCDGVVDYVDIYFK